MEEFFSLLGSLPNWLRNLVYAFGGISLAGIGVAFSWKVALIAAFFLCFVLVVLGFYAYFLKYRRERAMAAMSGQLEQNTLATPVAINDPARKARLEDIRRRFQEGIDKFKAVGKDLYKLPWYVVIGEPAAGKSEAIRRCDVGFPPGMQDDFQGVGGTINMNWWFTNYAVILDTAGRLLFEEVVPGTTSEWKEFLKMLRKNRPNCPINGLLLFIPADSLVKGTPKQISDRAGLIARQLDGIQRELDIRFPVYVIISKCDLLNGFREFFENVDDPEAQRQMLGWSNPQPIDTPFVPDLVDQHLQVVVERLRERRLHLLQDPVANDSTHRRIDEVDRLYAFPNSISLISQNLRRYLSTIFVSSEWSAKPLFLRGIYFTSSLREGAELDLELAQAVGVSIDTLPSGRIWERENSFFLRDLFLEKIFREWGLVTRATNTLKMVRGRKIALFGTLGLASLALILFSWFGYEEMKASIGHQSGYWLRASEGWAAENEWMPIVSPSGKSYIYNGDQPIGRSSNSATNDLFDGSNKTLMEFHSVLREFAGEKLKISPVFRPLTFFSGNLDAERKRAQRIVFEGSVVKPLVENTRNKITNESAGGPTDPKLEATALLSLVQIETGIIKRRLPLPQTIAPPDAVLLPMETYLVSRENDDLLTDLSAWTYAKGDGAGKWPPDWLSAGDTIPSSADDTHAKDSPTYNQPLDVGIEHFRKSALSKLAETEANWQRIIDLVDFLKNQVTPKEQDVFQGAANQKSIQQIDTNLTTPTELKDPSQLNEPYEKLQDMNGETGKLKKKLEDDKAAGLFADGPETLEAAYDLVMKNRKSEQALLKSWIDPLLAETVSNEVQGSTPAPLLKEIQDRLNAIEKESQADLQGINVGDLKTLDENYLNDYQQKGPVYAFRWSLYEQSFDTTGKKATFDKLIGQDWGPLKTLIEKVNKTRQEVALYEGSFKTECSSACNYWLDYTEQNEIKACCNAYLQQAKDEVTPALHFPLVWPPDDSALTVNQIVYAKKRIQTIHDDLHSETFRRIKPETRAPLESFDKKLSLLDPVIHALVGMDNKAATCSITGPMGSPPAPPPPPPYVPPPPPTPVVAPDGTTNFVAAPTPPPPPEAPEAPRYELREGTWPDNGKSEHINLGGQGQVPLGSPTTLISDLGVDRYFHFHRYDTGTYDNGMGPVNHLEIPCGFDWSIVRLLSKGNSSGDGTAWSIKFDDLHPDVTINVTFQRPLPSISQWPTRESVLSGE